MPPTVRYDSSLLLRGVTQRLVHVAGHPQGMQEDGQLAGHGDHGPFLRVLPSPCSQAQAPSPQITVRSERPQNVVRAIHQEAAQQGVAALGDAELGCSGAGVVLPRTQSQVGPDAATGPEAVRFFEGEHKRERRDRAHPAYSDPLVWRRIEVPDSYSFWDLHVAIQDAMGWLDYHLHEFSVVHPRTGRMQRIGIPDQDDPGKRPLLADWEVQIEEYFTDGGPPALYLYDFGDDWRHLVAYEGPSTAV